MTTTTTTLTEFLLARITEDEAVARETLSVSLERGNLTPVPYIERLEPDRDGSVLAPPAFVLAECEAKRRIVEMLSGSPDFHQGVLARDNYRPYHSPSIDVLVRVTQLLALPYASHPDYRDEWRP